MRLLSPMAAPDLEAPAKKAHELTLRYFGRTIQLYTPLYLSNYCENACVYCGFNSANAVERKKLTLEEVEREAKIIAESGLKHILMLTGESRAMSPLSYIKDCVKVLKRYFSSLSIEAYPLDEDGYAELVREGVDGLTIYQETYDEITYGKVHPSGPKRDFKYRFDAPQRGAKAGMRSVNIGVLLGLNDWRKDIFLTGRHAKYLQDEYPDIEIGVSIPRIRPQIAGFKAPYKVSDKDLAQIIIALRLFLPRSGITISTRESPSMRENLLSLGITRMSAGSSTSVGGRLAEKPERSLLPQFEISDSRSVAEIKSMLEQKGYQPILKDWEKI